MAEKTAKAQGRATRELQTELSRDLSCFDVTMIGVGAMIGAGIFVLTGIAAGTAGPALILAFALNGVVTVLTAMVYAELGSAIPEAGGGYLWIKEGLPGGNAFLAGWMSWFAHAVAGSLYALGFGAYLQLVLSSLGISLFGLPGPIAQKLLAAAVAVVFVYINYRGVSETGLVGNIVTLAKILVLGVFVVSGLVAIGRHPEFLQKFTPFAPNGLTGVVSAMGLTFIAFEGYEIIVQAGEEVRNPRKNIPRAVFWSLAIVIPIYLLVAFAALGAVTPGTGEASWQWLGKHAELGLAEAARQFMPFGTLLLLVGGLLSTMSALNATTFSSTRVSFAMGRDRNLPDPFAAVHERTQTPIVALLASGGIIIAVAVAVPIQHVAAAADIMFLLLFLQVNIAALTIRKKYGDKLRYGYLIPFFPAVPVIGIVTLLGLALFLFHYSPLAWYVALAWIAVGWGVWQWYARPRERGKRMAPILSTERLRPEKERLRILLPVGNVRTVEGLVHFACQLARVEDGEVILLHTLAIPRQLPPSASHALIQQARPAIDEATEFAEGQGARVSSLVRMSHLRTWRSIVDTSQEYQVDFVVMGWRGRAGFRRYILGQNVDKVVTHANCDVVVFQNPPSSRLKRLLVAMNAPHQGELMLKVARLLAARRGKIDLLHIVPPGATAGAEAQKTLEALNELAREANEGDTRGPKVSVVVEEAFDPVGKIIQQAREYDLLVIGPQHDGWLRQRLYGTTAQRIAASVQCPLALVNQRTSAITHGVRSFFEFFRDLEEKVREEEAETRPAPGAEGDGPAGEAQEEKGKRSR